MIPPEMVKLDCWQTLKYVILLSGVSSSFLCCYILLTSYCRIQETETDSLTKMYFIVAGISAVVRLIITCVACFLCVVKERTRDEVDMVPTKPLKVYMGWLIGLGRVFALLVACLQFAYTSVSADKRMAVLISILCTLLGSFCMTEFLHLLQVFGVIHPAVQRDLGYFKFVIAAAICAVQNLYGSGGYMALTVIPCIILNLFSGVILQCPKSIG